MPADHIEPTEPRRLHWLNWKWLSLGLLAGVVLILCVLQVRNQQQWSRVRKFQRSVEQAAGECRITAWVGTDFWRLWRADQRDIAHKFSWPTVDGVSLNPETRFDEIDWTLAPAVEVRFLQVDNAEFFDEALARIPAATPFHMLNFRNSKITNRSLPAIMSFARLGNISTLGTQIDGPGLLQLLKQRDVSVDPYLRTADLKALAEAGLHSRVMNFELQADDDFSVAQLQGVDRGYQAVFRGTYGEDAFQDAQAVPLRYSRLVFADARLHARNLSDLARISSTDRILLEHVEIVGESQSGTPNPPQQTLLIAVRNSSMPAQYFHAFAGRPFAIFVDDPTVDDAWLEEVMQITGLRQVIIANSKVSETTLDKYKLGSGRDAYVSTARRLGSEWDSPRRVDRS